MAPDEILLAFMYFCLNNRVHPFVNDRTTHVNVSDFKGLAGDVSAFPFLHFSVPLIFTFIGFKI